MGHEKALKYYYRDAIGIIYVYDLTNRQSFESLSRQIEDLPNNVSNLAIKILIGNKKDLQQNREVSFTEGKQLANSLGFHFFETSALLKINVEEAINQLLQDIIQKALFSMDKKAKYLGAELYQRQFIEKQ